MADITKDSFNEANDFTKVIFQRGRDLLDFELNEFQDILRTFASRLGEKALGITQAYSGAMRAYSSDTGWQVVTTGVANQITINAGSIMVDGIVQQKASSSTFAVTTWTSGTSYDAIYLTVAEAEVSDPNTVPQLGATTTRRQLSVTVNKVNAASAALAIAAVPSSSATALYQGGTHYYLIAVVRRDAAIVSADDITDYRLPTPAALLFGASGGGLVRYSNHHTIDAIVTPAIEAPGRGVLGVDNQLYLDTNPDGTVSSAEYIYFRSKARAAGARVMGAISRYMTPFTGTDGNTTIGSWDLPTQVMLRSTDVLHFGDDNIATTMGSYSPFVALSTSDAWGSQVLVGEKDVPAQVSGGVYANTAMLTALNARVLTVGDGTQSFGDFSGPNAIAQALNFVFGTGATTCSITVKTGVYTVDGASSQINIPANKIAYLRGDGFVVINGTSASYPVATMGAGATLSMDSIVVGNSAYSGPGGLQATSPAYVTLKNCAFLAGINLINPVKFLATDTQFTSLQQYEPAIYFTVGTISGGASAISCDSYVFNSCKFTGAQQAACVLFYGNSSIGTGTYVVELVQFNVCEFVCDGSTTAGSTPNFYAPNSGPIELNANGRYMSGGNYALAIRKLRMLGCTVVSALTSAYMQNCTVLRVCNAPAFSGSPTVVSSSYFHVNAFTLRDFYGSQDVTVSSTASGNDLSPFLIGLANAEVVLENVTYVNRSSDLTKYARNGRCPANFFPYLTGGSFPASTTVATADSTAAAISVVDYGLGTLGIDLYREPSLTVHNLQLHGFYGNSTGGNHGGELAIVRAGKGSAVVQDVSIGNYRTIASTGIAGPTQRVLLRAKDGGNLSVRRLRMAGITIGTDNWVSGSSFVGYSNVYTLPQRAALVLLDSQGATANGNSVLLDDVDIDDNFGNGVATLPGASIGAFNEPTNYSGSLSISNARVRSIGGTGIYVGQRYTASPTLVDGFDTVLVADSYVAPTAASAQVGIVIDAPRVQTTVRNNVVTRCGSYGMLFGFYSPWNVGKHGPLNVTNCNVYANNGSSTANQVYYAVAGTPGGSYIFGYGAFYGNSLRDPSVVGGAVGSVYVGLSTWTNATPTYTVAQVPTRGIETFNASGTIYAADTRHFYKGYAMVHNDALLNYN